MKQQSLQLLYKTLGVLFLTLVIGTFAFASPGGSPASKTGSPGDNSNCVSCHGGSAVAVSGWITSNIPSGGYVPGTIYTITATATGTGRKGFEVSPQNVTGTQLGVLAAGTGSKLVGGTKYVTQTAAGSSSGTSIWNFTWTAPATGTGNVTFYGAFCVGKANTKLSTLEVTESAGVPLTATASATPGLICAGETSQLNVVPAGGSGNYTYSWTSIPAGFTSAAQNPMVTPGINTQYIAHVSDGSLAADAPANVTVNQVPEAFAGSDTTCANAVTQVPLHGTATSYSSVSWLTSGTGTFSNAGALTGYYFPSAADKTGMNVTLTLSAAAVSPCATAATDARTIHFDFPAGVPADQRKGINMVISPNPSHGQFTIQISGLDNKNATITVSDITGRMMVQRILARSENGREQFDLSGQPKGIYLIKIQADNDSMVRKMIID